ncbi:hypothetical protein N431DRAFT_544045 [Stipitochalara longipes BDJ]|nr:hypothetical protein N431DRAFT_544045 [Stipitochalara longipes BDJ]
MFVSHESEEYLGFSWVWPMVALFAMCGGNRDFVTFRVGTGRAKKSFLVHKTMTCNASPVLKAAFNSTFAEGQTQTYTMDDVDADVFKSFVKWLYTKKLTHEFYTISDVWYKVDEQQQRCELNKCLQKLADLWMLADRLLIPKLQDRIISQLRGTWRDGGFIHARTWRKFLNVDIQSASQMHDFAVYNVTYCRHEGFVQKAANFFQAMLIYLVTRLAELLLIWRDK